MGINNSVSIITGERKEFNLLEYLRENKYKGHYETDYIFCYDSKNELVEYFKFISEATRSSLVIIDDVLSILMSKTAAITSPMVTGYRIRVKNFKQNKDLNDKLEFQMVQNYNSKHGKDARDY